MDALNRVVQVNDAIGGLTTTVYDAASNVQAIVDPDGNRTTYTLDALNRVIQETDPLGHNTTLAYDAASRLTSTTDRNGRSSGDIILISPRGSSGVPGTS